MGAMGYMHGDGGAREEFRRVGDADSKPSGSNPTARGSRQATGLEDQRDTRAIVEPLHLLDCCQETDGGQALVITSTERARDLPHPPAVVAGAAQGASRGQESMLSYYRDDIAGLPEMGLVAEQLWAQSGIG